MKIYIRFHIEKAKSLDLSDYNIISKYNYTP